MKETVSAEIRRRLIVVETLKPGELADQVHICVRPEIRKVELNLFLGTWPPINDLPLQNTTDVVENAVAEFMILDSTHDWQIYAGHNNFVLRRSHIFKLKQLNVNIELVLPGIEYLYFNQALP